jgi:hypothetical protein
VSRSPFEYVLEGIQASSPRVAAQQPRELAGEAVEVGEVGSVDDQYGRVVAVVGHDPSMRAIATIRFCRTPKKAAAARV